MVETKSIRHTYPFPSAPGVHLILGEATWACWTGRGLAKIVCPKLHTLGLVESCYLPNYRQDVGNVLLDGVSLSAVPKETLLVRAKAYTQPHLQVHRQQSRTQCNVSILPSKIWSIVSYSSFMVFNQATLAVKANSKWEFGFSPLSGRVGNVINTSH